MKPYNGHRSWNAWNVALWIGNDESLYRFAMDCIRPQGDREVNFYSAARRFTRGVFGKTPDGATYNQLSVRLALEGLAE